MHEIEPSIAVWTDAAVNSPEILAREPLSPLVIGAMGTLQDAHFYGFQDAHPYDNTPVQTTEHGFGGYAYLSDGTLLCFTDALPGSVPDDDELQREQWRGQGFTDEEIDSGISKLVTISAGRTNTTNRVLIAGLLDGQPGSRVLRQQEDGACADSGLTREETEAIARLGFLSQLVGYVSARYADRSPYDAVSALIEELETNEGLDGNLLRNMLLARQFPGQPPNGLETPAIVAGMLEFSDLVSNHRDRMSRTDEPVRSGVNYRAQRLVQSGEYYSRIMASLDLAVDAWPVV